jgi:hypothetical protein
MDAPPPVKSGPGGFMRCSRVIFIRKTQTATCQPTRGGMKETFQLGLIYEALGCQVPSMGPRMRQLLAILCVTSSFALFARGGADPSSGF